MAQRFLSASRGSNRSRQHLHKAKHTFPRNVNKARNSWGEIEFFIKKEGLTLGMYSNGSGQAKQTAFA